MEGGWEVNTWHDDTLLEIYIIYHIQFIFQTFYTLPCYNEKVMNQFKCLSITNPGFTDLKPLGGFMVSSIKRVSGTPKDSEVNSKLSSWNDFTVFRDLNWIHWKFS